MSGSFVATGQNKHVQHLEGGILREVLVKEGDLVEVGQPLLRLDATAASSRLRRLVLQEPSPAHHEGAAGGRDRRPAFVRDARRAGCRRRRPRDPQHLRAPGRRAARAPLEGCERGGGAAQGDRRPAGKHRRLCRAGAIDAAAHGAVRRGAEGQAAACWRSSSCAGPRSWRCSAPKPRSPASSAS